MSLRDTIRHKPAVAITIVATCLLLGIVGLIYYFASAQPQLPPAQSAWFVDLETGEHFLANTHQIPPFQMENGHTAVRARLYTCSDCDENKFVGLMERYTPEAIERARQRNEPLPRGGLEISRDGKTWVSAYDFRGDALRRYLETYCQGKPAEPCPAEQK